MALSDFLNMGKTGAANIADSVFGVFKERPDKELGQAGIAFLIAVFRCDDNFDPEEQQALTKLLGVHPFFKIFEKHEKIIRDKKDELNKQFLFGVENGIEACMVELEDVARYDDKIKKALVQVAMLAGQSGGLSQIEKDTIKIGVIRLGLSPADFPKLA